MRRRDWLLLAGSAPHLGAWQARPARPQVLTFLSAVDDTDQPYALYLPKAYDRSRRYPLVVSLHGAGSNHRLNLRRVFGQGNRYGETDAEATRYWPRLKDVDYIVASPLARGTMGYQGIAEKDVLDVLADVKSRFSIDEDRVYLTGLSMGGGGTLWLGLTRPDVWAAIAPVCPAPPPGTIELAANALHIPVKIFQGAADPVVPAASVRQFHEELTSSGVKAQYVEYPGVRHNSWDYAYKDAAIFDWFVPFRRVRSPDRVHFVARDYAHGSAYWVRFDSLTPGTNAEIDARFEARQKLAITTRNLDGFTLLLKGHRMAPPAGPLSVTIDGAAVRAPRAGRQGEVSFKKTGTRWAAGAAVLEPGEKRPGAEGPIAAAIGSRHIYVYGTADGAGPAEVLRRREQAAYAAEWSTSRSRLLLTFRVMADSEVKDADLKGANVVAFGTRESNSLLARLAPRLPMALNPGAADYGLVYVYPVEGYYVVVSSGLPWWTRIDQAERPGLSFLAAPYRALLSFGDYLLFRGGVHNVVAEGRFDRMWQLPPDPAERIRATRAVEVRSA